MACSADTNTLILPSVPPCVFIRRHWMFTGVVDIHCFVSICYSIEKILPFEIQLRRAVLDSWYDALIGYVLLASAHLPSIIYDARTA